MTKNIRHLSINQKTLKMKKVFYLLGIVMVCCVFTFCNKTTVSPTNNPEDLIGTWDLYEATSVKGDETHTVPQEDIEDWALSYTFFADRTGIQYYQETVTDIKWSADETTLESISNVGVVISSWTYTVNSNNLSLSYQSGEYKITHKFKRRSK